MERAFTPKTIAPALAAMPKVPKMVAVTEAAARLGMPICDFYRELFAAGLVPDALLARGMGHTPLFLESRLETLKEQLLGLGVPGVPSTNLDLE